MFMGKIFNNRNASKNKGAMASVNGKAYELKVYNTLKKTLYSNKPFNTQSLSDLGGSSSRNDIECEALGLKIGIEIKKKRAPDWGQCSIKYSSDKWQCSDKCRMPVNCQNLFNKIINDSIIFKGQIPPFMIKPITHSKWLSIKKKCKTWNDEYISIPSDTIRKLYQFKNCHYIQISDYGLYHLGEDVCNFGVPIFEVDQRLRIRTKIHNRSNSNGMCVISVTAALQPINISTLEKSLYSLDSIDSLPHQLKFVL